jgi:hypothetical protein
MNDFIEESKSKLSDKWEQRDTEGVRVEIMRASPREQIITWSGLGSHEHHLELRSLAATCPCCPKDKKMRTSDWRAQVTSKWGREEFRPGEGLSALGGGLGEASLGPG